MKHLLPEVYGYSGALSPNEERALFHRYQTEDSPKVKSRIERSLVRANTGYVRKLAIRFLHHKVSLDDLIQEGVIALVKSMTSFDPEKGTRIISYAYFPMMKAMWEVVRRNGSVVTNAIKKNEDQLPDLNFGDENPEDDNFNPRLREPRDDQIPDEILTSDAALNVVESVVDTIKDQTNKRIIELRFFPKRGQRPLSQEEASKSIKPTMSKEAVRLRENKTLIYLHHRVIEALGRDDYNLFIGER